MWWQQQAAKCPGLVCGLCLQSLHLADAAAQPVELRSADRSDHHRRLTAFLRSACSWRLAASAAHRLHGGGGGLLLPSRPAALQRGGLAADAGGGRRRAAVRFGHSAERGGHRERCAGAAGWLMCAPGSRRRSPVWPAVSITLSHGHTWHSLVLASTLGGSLGLGTIADEQCVRAAP